MRPSWTPRPSSTPSALAQAQETWFGLSSLAERLRATAGLAAERHRHLSAEPVAERPGRDPDELDRQAAELREEEDSLQARLAVGRDRLTTAVSERSGAEAELARVERRIADDARAAATRADRLARLRGQVGAASSRQATAAEELERLVASAAEARARAERAQHEHSEVAEQVSGHDEGRAELAATHEEAGALLAAASAQVSELRKAEAEATRRYTALRARVETLQEAFRRGADASADLLADTGQTGSVGRFSGIIGPFAEAITIADGAQVAIAAALGAAANAVAVTDLNAAIAVLTVLRESGAGTAGLVIAGHPDVGHSVASRSRSRTDRADLPSGARYALDLVQATDELRPAVTQLLGGVVVAASLEQAADLTRATPGLRVVTRDGDVLGAHWAIGGSAGQQSLLEVRAAADDAATGLQEAQDQCENAAERLAVALSAESAARLAVDEARARMRQADSGAAEISGRLGRLAGAARAAGDEVRRLETAIETAQRAGEKDQARLAELTGQLTEAEASARSRGPGRPGRRWPGRGRGRPERRRRDQGHAGPAVHDGPQRRDGSAPGGAHGGGAAARHRGPRGRAELGRHGRAAGP